MNERDLFIAVLQKETSAECRAYLDQACQGNDALRQSVEALLEANARAGSFLGSPAPASQLAATVDDPITERPGAVIGAYKLLEQIGEGGFGVVFMAEQQEPIRRKVALKVLKPGMDTRQVIARFEAERQALALMDHPHIAKVLDAGQTGTGRPYFVMDLVRGLPITEFCDQSQLTPAERLGLFVDVCQAVQHAHQKGIIHRDLKPSNVLVTLQDGTPLVKVIDFGIAKALGQQLTDKTVFTGFAQMIGTPLYMSPEQAALSNVDADTRSDIYSLGVLLYELLTGTTPFDKARLQQAGYDEMRRIIREEEPPKPSTRISTLGQAAATVSTQRKSDPKRLSQLCRGELDWIVMKALEKDRNRRYETASTFAADVQRYLRDEPVQACPPSAAYRLRKFARRRRTALAMLAVVAAALVTALIVFGASELRVREEHQARELALNDKAAAEKQRADAEEQRADKETERADEQTKRAEAEKLRAEALDGWRQTAYYQGTGLALHEYRANNVARADEMLASDKCPEDLRRWEWHYLKRLCHSELSVAPLAVPESRFITLSPDGTRLALLSATESRLLPDGATRLITQGVGGQTLAPAGVPFGPLAQLAAASQAAPFNTSAQVVHIYNVPTGKEELSFLVRGQSPNALAFSPDGKWLATCGNESFPTTSVRVWNARTGEEGPMLRGADRWGYGEAPPGVIPGITYLHFQSSVAAQTLVPGETGLGLTAQLLWARSVVMPTDLMAIWPGAMWGVAISPDGQLVAGTDVRGRLQVWERASGKELFRRAAHPILNSDTRSNSVWSTMPVFSPDGKLIATACSDDATFKLWDARTGDFVRSLWQGPLDKEEGFSRAVFSPKGKWIAAAGRHDTRFPDPSVRVWDVAAGRTRYVFRGTKTFSCLAFSPDENLLAAGSGDNTLTIWELATGREVAVYRGHENGVRAVAFRDNERVVSLDGNRTIRIWDATRAPEYRTFRTWAAWHAAVSSDGRRVAAAASQFDPANPKNKAFHTFVWDAETGRILMKYEDHMESPRQVAFSPDGQFVASAISIGTAEGVVRIFDAGTGKLVRNLPDHGPAARGPAHLIAQALGARAAAPTGVPLGALTLDLASLPVMKLDAYSVRAAPCDAVAWSPDGKLIASAGQDRVVRLWDAATGAPVRVLPGHARSISALAFSRDGKRLASASGGIIRHGAAMNPNPLKLPEDRPTDIPDVKVWDVATGKELHSWSLPGKGPGMALSPDGETIAVTFGETGVDIHSALFPGGGSKVMWTTLAARSGDVVRLYRVATGKEVAVLKGHTRPPFDVAFSPDGLRIVTAGGVDESVKLWDARTGEEIMTVGRHPGIVTSVAFSSDGRKIVSTSDDMDVRIWDAAPTK